MRKCIGVLLLALAATPSSYGQYISIVNNKFVANGNSGCQIYFNGANTPWESWNDFGGSYSATKWEQDMVDLKAKGINATRIWFSCNGSGQPSVASDGTVSAPSSAFWSNCDDLFSHAQANGVYVMATLMSFDHTKTGNTNASNWRTMMSDTSKIRTYINNYLIPFVNRYKTNPYLWSIDICNEIEWIKESTDNWQTTYPVLQRFVAMCCVAMHSTAVARTDGSYVLVTLGSAATKWNGTKMRNGSYGTGWQTNSDGNKWSDAALQAQYSNTKAYLDFYSPHFYGWINEYYSNPFEKSPSDFGMSEKACMIGEMPSRDPMPIPISSSSYNNMALSTAFANLMTLGWQGHMPWTSNITTNLSTEVGSLADFGAAALAFATTNSALVYPTCTVVPTCEKPGLGTDVSLCGITGGVTLNSNLTSTTNKTFTWYRDTTQVSGTASTLTSVSTAGTYIVVVDSASGTCTSSDTIIVSSTIPAPTLASANICDPATVTLSAAVSGAGLSFQWYLGSTAIDGATSATLSDIRSAGTYTVVISATGCTSQSASTTVTSDLPTPVDGCRGDAGIVALGITNTTSTNYGWYSSATDETLLGSGLTFNTPSIATTTTYYVQDLSSVSASFGKSTQSGTPIWNINDFTSTDKKQKLVVTQATTLESVKAYVVSDGMNVTVRLRNSTDGATVDSSVFTNVSSGLQTLSGLTFDLDAGEYYLDAVGSTTSLQYEGWTNTSTYSYPYSVIGIIQLENSTSWNNVGYGPFYELTIASGSNCARLPVVAKIDASCGTTNKTPHVIIAAPSTGTEFLNTATITITATANDTDGTIASVTFYDGTTLLGTATSSPYTISWTGAATGPHTISAVATDNDGATTTSTTITINVLAQQTISLGEGWNLISFNVHATDSSIATVFSSIISSIVTIKTEDAFYNPSQQSAYNSLTSIEVGKAYLVKIKTGSASSLTTKGYVLDPSTCPLETGWNLVGYPLQASSDIISSLSSIWTQFIVLKNFDGFNKKNGSTNSLSQLEPGKGYFVKVSAAAALTW